MNVWLILVVTSEVSLGKSIHHLISSSPLRMINSLDPPLNRNASLPIRMEVNSGKSSHHSPSGRFTLKHGTRTVIQSIATKHKGFQTGQVYSSFHSIRITLQLQCCMNKVVTLIHYPHFDHLQRRQILNLTRGIIREGITTHL